MLSPQSSGLPGRHSAARSGVESDGGTISLRQKSVIKYKQKVAREKVGEYAARSKMRDTVVERVGTCRNPRSRKKVNSHLVDLHRPLLDGHLRPPSCKRALRLQRLGDISQDHLRIFVFLGNLHGARRLARARHASADIGKACGIHIRSPSDGQLGRDPR